MADATCLIDGCEKRPVTRGWCKAHYTRWIRTGDVAADVPVTEHLYGAVCSVEGCGKPVSARGWCKTHYSRWARTGDAGEDAPVAMRHLPHAPNSQCAVDGCERHPKGGSKGWCHAHFERWRVTGDVRADVPLAASQRRLSAVCAIDSCGKRRSGRDWCSMHYSRWLKHGDPLHEKPKPTGCIVDDCDRPPASLGYCKRHYERVRVHGDPFAERPRLPNSEVNYFHMHARLRQARGSSTAYRCVGCDRHAEQWAWIHDEDPCDFDSYVPMCRSCHKRYDPRPATGERIAWWRRWHEARDAFAGKRGDVA